MLGIDNIVFISILVDRLPPERREVARRIGLFLPIFMRMALLLTLAWIIGLIAPIATVLGNEISGRDLILLAGGVFLIWKATGEIHEMDEDHAGHQTPGAAEADGLDFHVPKGCIYFAMAFSVGVEMLNLRMRHPRFSGCNRSVTSRRPQRPGLEQPDHFPVHQVDFLG